MGVHVYIDGIKITQNTGVDIENTLNFISADLTNGKTFLKNRGNSSEEISFKTILTTVPDQVSIYEPIYFALREKTKKTSVPIIVGDLKFDGIIVECVPNFPVENYKEYKWVIKEFSNFKPSIKEFKTFNYKAPKITAKTTAKSNVPAYIKKLYNCNVGRDCNKKGVKCVYYLQKLLQTDGYYLNYKYDGCWCTYTTQEFKKWQKRKAKVKVTGKLDKYTKTYLKKRFKLSDNKIKTNVLYKPSVPVNL